MIKVVKHLIALNYPSHLKVISKLNRRFDATLKEIYFQVRVGLTFHQSKSLITPALVNWEDQDNMISILKSVSKFFCWACWSCPHAMLCRQLYTLIIEAFNDKKSSPTSYYRFGCLNQFLNVCHVHSVSYHFLFASYQIMIKIDFLLSETTSEKVPPNEKLIDCVSWSLSMMTELSIWYSKNWFVIPSS